jgi:ketosteroid isomerase-like protein
MNHVRWLVTPLAGLLCCGLLACTAVLAADTERVALDAAVQRWTTAVNARDRDALTATMTRDVELIDANATVSGRDAVLRALRDVATRGQLFGKSREVTIVGDIAWRVAGLAQTRKDGIVHARGQAMEIWKRVNGEWRLHRQMSAGLLLPEVSLTRPPPDEPVLDRPEN